MRHLVILNFLFIIIGLASCNKDEQPIVDYNQMEYLVIPDDFPDMVFPTGNEFTQARWLLGKTLFYDQRLSVDQSISCGDCHKQSFGFGDNAAFTPGVFKRPAVRNAPSLSNIGYHPYYTREGGVPTLEMQVLVPVSEHNEFGFNLVEIVKRLEGDAKYQQMARNAYNRDLDAFVITRAISNFERSLISGNSKYDLYVRGDTKKLNNQELEGKELFFSPKTSCSQCHGGFNFTDYSFENNGLYTNYSDEGRFKLTQLPADLALFKTPSLRNIGLTAPYMHDGSLKTLDEVIDHYNEGGKDHKNKSPLIKKLNLSVTEKNALKAFLLTLDDNTFITNKYFRAN